MKLALLGTDADILQLAAAARQAGHEIAWVGDIRRDDAAAVGQLAPRFVDRSTEWELLLAQGAVDGVLVGRGEATAELRTEQLKRLVTEAIPLLVVHPAFESVLPYYEIDMARRESGGLVKHYNPLVGRPELNMLAEWVRSGHPTLGTIHQVTCERRVAGASRSIVLKDLARDIELLALVAGDIRRVSAIGPATPDATFASLQIQMTSSHVASLRWSVGSLGANGEASHVTLLAEHGTVTLRESNADQPGPTTWQLETTSNDQRNVQPLEAYDPARTAIRQFTDAIAEPNSMLRSAMSTWEAATRAMEVVDAVELSLQKGRTIEVFQQQLTERLAFRGVMAALGCGLLLVAFLAIVVAAMLGTAEGVLRPKIASAWPLALLAVLAFFLLLQAVPFLAQKSKKGDDTPISQPPDQS